MVNGRFDAHSTQHDLTWDTSFLGMDHKILVGLDAFWLDHRDRRTGDLIAPVDVFAPRSDPTVVEAGGQFRNYGFDLKSRLVGFYAQDQVTVLKDQPGVHKLLLLAGGRCHMAQESLRRFGEVFGSPVTDPLTSRTDSAFSPRVGLLYMPTERLSLYGSWSRSFKPQGAFTTLNGRSDPQIGEQVEIRAQAEIGSRLFASVSLFDITKSNVPGPSPIPGITALSGEVRSRGVELELNGEVPGAPGLQLASAYTYLDTEITRGDESTQGNRLFGAPRHAAGVWASYIFQPGSSLAGIGMGAGVTYVGDVFGSNENSFKLKPYTVVDLGLWYRPKLSGPVQPEFPVNLKNLFNEGYYLTGDGYNSAQPSPAQPSAPRSVVASVKLRF